MKNKNVLITGGTGGIGFSVVKAFLNESAFVVFMGKNEESVERMKTLLSEEYSDDTFFGIHGDFRQDAVFVKLFTRFDDFDVIINNAGYFEQKEFEDITDEDWSNVLEVNLMSGVKISRFYFPKMLNKNWGRIIFMSCGAGVELPDGMLHYGVSKTAVLSVMQGLANLTRGSRGVTVNAILPGLTDTESLNKFLSTIASNRRESIDDVKKNFFKNVKPGSLINRFIQPQEIAEAIIYICKCGDVINGTTLDMTGGSFS